MDGRHALERLAHGSACTLVLFIDLLCLCAELLEDAQVVILSVFGRSGG